MSLQARRKPGVRSSPERGCDRALCAAQLWYKLAEKAHLKEKIEHMFDGAHLNVTEDRSVLHVALRAPRDYVRPALQLLHALFVCLREPALGAASCVVFQVRCTVQDHDCKLLA